MRGSSRTPSLGAIIAVVCGLLLGAGCGGDSGGGGGGTNPPPVTVSSIDLSPTSVSINVGESAQVQAVAKTATGQVVSGSSISWSSGNPGVASVSSTGIVTGVSAGTATLTA